MPEHRVPSDIQRADFPTEWTGLKREGDKIMLAYGLTVPASGQTGYGKACLFLHVDGTGTTDLFFVNEGDETSANFVAH